jgi:hypothetical protein
VTLVSEAAEIEVPEGHVGIPIDQNLARLALIAFDGLNKLSGAELMKLQGMLQADFGGKKATAKNVGAMFRIVGFTFSQALHEAREKRIQEEKEQANASDNSEAS